MPSGCSESSSAWPTGTTNNGNVGGYYYTDSANTGLSHPAAYTYDGVNRLIGAAATGNVSYNQTYSYDIYGNLNCSPSGPGCVAFSYNANKNQINGYGYDQAGNVTNDGTYNYQWDAEGHLGTVSQSGNVVSMNTYNALGQRVEDATATSTTDEAYGAGGDLLLRYTGDSNSRSFVPFGGGLLAEYFCGGMIFDHPDELGSLTASTDCTGHTVNEKLFYPFGESWTGAALPNLGAHQTFGKLPDYAPETDEYNTANRHYSPSGRWMSPDPGGLKAVLTDNPQTWNMYAYAGNNPSSFRDPFGTDPKGPGCKMTCMAAMGGLGLAAIVASDGLAAPAVAGAMEAAEAAEAAAEAASLARAIGLGVGAGIAASQGGDASPQGDYGSNPWCDAQYEADLQVCRAAKSAACYAQALQRKIACEQNNPLPPLTF